jgi:hypothetical protein
MNGIFRKVIFGIVSGAMLIGLGAMRETRADSVLYTASSGALSASANFVFDGNNTLTVTLTNLDATAGKYDPSHVLTAVFFNDSASPFISPISASLNGSSVLGGSLVNNVGEGWMYQSNLTGTPENMNSGISAAGLGVFPSNPANTSPPWFYTPPVTPLDGVGYGIVGASATGVSGNNGPVISNSIVFSLTTPSDFNLSDLGNSVVFQYGSTLAEPSVGSTPGAEFSPAPAPAQAIALSGICVMFVVWGLRKAWRSRRSLAAPVC